MTSRNAIRSGLGVLVLTVGLTACAGQQPQPVIVPAGGKPSAAAIVRTAESMLGKPYRQGGSLPDGFDCSGLVVYVFARQGWEVPRDVKRQSAVGGKVARSDVRAGDLVFFTTTGPGATHVAIAVDRNRFIHAPKGGAVVRIESLQTTYWEKRFLYGRRLTR
jgi:cell wall-associated NlpC family hydrolase